MNASAFNPFLVLTIAIRCRNRASRSSWSPGCRAQAWYPACGDRGGQQEAFMDHTGPHWHPRRGPCACPSATAGFKTLVPKSGVWPCRWPGPPASLVDAYVPRWRSGTNFRAQHAIISYGGRVVGNMGPRTTQRQRSMGSRSRHRYTASKNSQNHTCTHDTYTSGSCAMLGCLIGDGNAGSSCFQGGDDSSA